jgi:hypothetical protein
VASFYLDPGTWDMVLDAKGNWALATDPYSLAQDAACKIRTFLGDIYYDQTQGIDYFGLILSHTVSLPLIKATLVATALQTQGVVAAQVFITAFDPTNRVVSGQIQVTDTAGNVAAASF